MPNVKTVDAGDVGLNPSQAGEAAWREAAGAQVSSGRIIQHEGTLAGTAIGRGIRDIAGGLGDLYEQSQAHDDTLAATDASRKSADFDLQQNIALDNIMAPKPDPNDPTGQKKITPDANDAPALIGKALQKWQEDRAALRETITNDKALKKFDQETATSYKAFTHKAYAVNSELAYRAAGDNITKSAQSYAGLVYSDPTQLDAMLTKMHGTVTDLSETAPGLTADQRAGFKTEVDQKASRAIIESAVEGLAKTPLGRQKAEELVNSGKYDQYIGQDRDKLLNHIRGQERAYQADQTAARTQQEAVEKQNALKATDEYVQDAASGNPQKKAQDIWTDPRFANRPDLRKNALGVMETMRKAAKDDLDVSPILSHKTTLDLFGRMALPDGDPNKITDRSAIDQAFIHGDLTRADYNWVQTQLKAMSAPGMKQLTESRKDFFNKYSSTMDPTRAAGGGATALGSQNIFKAQQDAIQQEQALIKAGKDPKSLYDPNSPDFFGRAENLAKYHTSVKDANDFQLQNDKDLKSAIEKFAPAGDNMAKAKASIASIESGSPKGNYRAVSEPSRDGDRAYGKYQVMGKNIGNWTEKYAGKRMSVQEFINSPDAQEKVFEGEFGRLMSKYGPEGAAKAWFAGEGGMSNARARDVYGTTVAGYGSRFSTLYGNSGGEPMAIATVPPSYTDVKTPADAYKLPPGTKIRLPDGRTGVVPSPQVPMSK